VVYDTQKSSRGFLCLKAYRLTPQAIQMYKDGDFTPEAFRTLKVGYESLFAEIPIVIKNSPLTNIMMSELNELLPEDKGHNFLDLGTASVLENQMRSLIERVDELYQEAVRYNKYQQVVFKQDTVRKLILKLVFKIKCLIARVLWKIRYWKIIIKEIGLKRLKIVIDSTVLIFVTLNLPLKHGLLFY